jgi:alkaline phosphatase D
MRVTMDRRSFLELACAIGATAAWGGAFARSSLPWREWRDVYPEGVASGDPDSHSVLLWTRRPPHQDSAATALHVEIAEDESFGRVVATATAPISKASDWTCRVLVGRLRPSHVY